MSPTPQVQDDGDRISSRNLKIKEVLCDGYYYDVTDFVNHHPGGNIIQWYTHNGEDATVAIQQFHYRTSSKVKMLMKSFKRRPAKELHHTLDPKIVEKNKLLTEDFNKLFLELEAEGIFKPSYSHNILRLVEIIVMFIFGYNIFHFSGLLPKAVGILLMGLAQGRTGWMQHEAGHNSLTGIPWLEKIIQTVLYGVGIGMSAKGWRVRHNKHHGMPQRVHHDVDLAILPFIAASVKVLRNSKENSIFLRHQVFFYPILTFLGFIAFQLWVFPKYCIKHRAYLETFCILVHFLLLFKIGFFPFLLTQYILAHYLMSNFSLSHLHLPITTEPTHWVEYCFVHTSNVKPGWLCDWYMGYLNYQIEHHLFPAIPHFRLKLITKRVKAFAEKHGLPYQCPGFIEIVWKTFKHFRITEKDFQNVI